MQYLHCKTTKQIEGDSYDVMARDVKDKINSRSIETIEQQVLNL